VGWLRFTAKPGPSARTILESVAPPTDNDESGAYPAASSGEAPRTLGDLQTPMRMSRTGWLIASMIFVAALSFFVVVVLLGVTSS
jgi:hypothetical protein